MVERRLPKPKVAGSNPVFRSKETPPEPQTAAHRQRSFLFHLTHRSGKRGSPQDLLLPPVEGRGGYKKARNTRADFEPAGRKISVSSNPVFRSKETPPEPQTAAHRQRSFLFHLTHRSGKRGSPQDLLLPPVEGRGGYKKARNTRADFEPAGRKISVSSNPVFRSKETPPEPQTAAHRQRSFLFHLTHRSGKRGSPQDLLLPPVEGRGGYKKARNTRADFDPEGREISASSNPVFRSIKFPQNHRPQHPSRKPPSQTSPTRIRFPTFQRCAFSPRYHPTFRR